VTQLIEIREFLKGASKLLGGVVSLAALAYLMGGIHEVAYLTPFGALWLVGHMTPQSFLADGVLVLTNLIAMIWFQLILAILLRWTAQKIIGRQIAENPIQIFVWATYGSAFVVLIQLIVRWAFKIAISKELLGSSIAVIAVFVMLGVWGLLLKELGVGRIGWNARSMNYVLGFCFLLVFVYPMLLGGQAGWRDADPWNSNLPTVQLVPKEGENSDSREARLLDSREARLLLHSGETYYVVYISRVHSPRVMPVNQNRVDSITTKTVNMGWLRLIWRIRD